MNNDKNFRRERRRFVGGAGNTPRTVQAPLGHWSSEQNRNSRAQVKSLQGGFYFHPCDESLSLGPRPRKKPTRGRAAGYSDSGSAVDVTRVTYIHTGNWTEMDQLSIQPGTA